MGGGLELVSCLEHGLSFFVFLWYFCIIDMPGCCNYSHSWLSIDDQ